MMSLYIGNKGVWLNGEVYTVTIYTNNTVTLGCELPARPFTTDIDPESPGRLSAVWS